MDARPLADSCSANLKMSGASLRPHTASDTDCLVGWTAVSINKVHLGWSACLVRHVTTSIAL